MWPAFEQESGKKIGIKGFLLPVLIQICSISMREYSTDILNSQHEKIWQTWIDHLKRSSGKCPPMIVWAESGWMIKFYEEQTNLWLE